MNRPNPFATTTFFKPASQYLNQAFNAVSDPKKLRNNDSTGDADIEAGMLDPQDADGRMSRKDRARSGELTPRAIPLIDISRSPSPSRFARNRSAAQSEDEDDFEYDRDVAQSRPLVAKDIASGGEKKIAIFQRGGLGQFLFGSSLGWQIYIGLLVFWVGGCQFGLLLMNRFILWTGTYKFPYPLAMTLAQLIITHIFILGFASLTRGLEPFFNLIGLGAVVAPSHAYTKGNRPTRYRGGQRNKSILTNIKTWLTHASGGIAGGGLFEFQLKTAKHVLPVAIIYMAKVVLSNLSYAYAVLPMYMLARIASIPLTLLLTPLLTGKTLSIPTLSAALVATLNLLMATILPDRVTWESIVSGVFSSLFVALYPITLYRAYKSLVTDLAPQTDDPADDAPAPVLGSKEESRAYWRVLHYTSLLTILMLTPITILSGELFQIARNCYFLDVPWFWFLMVCGGLGSWAVFVSFLLLIKATSVVSAQFVSVPRSVFQLVVLNKFRLPAHSWVGASLCVASCVWFVLVRRREEWSHRRLKMEGRG